MKNKRRLASQGGAYAARSERRASRSVATCSPSGSPAVGSKSRRISSPRLITMPVRRTGSIEKRRDASGKVYYRGKVRLKDGSRARIEVDERFWYSEARARECVAAAQAEEDRTNAIYLAKLEGEGIRGSRAQRDDEDAQSYIRYLVDRCNRLEKRLAQRGIPDPDKAPSTPAQKAVL